MRRIFLIGISIGVVMIFLAALFALFLSIGDQSDSREADDQIRAQVDVDDASTIGAVKVYDPPVEVEDHLLQHVALVRNLFEQEDTLAVLRTINSRHVSLSGNDIAVFDEQWKSGVARTQFIRDHLNGPLSRSLAAFQDEHPQMGFGEIILTDRKGVLIAQTNIATDYYQADEVWWREASKDLVYFDKISRDASTDTLALPVSFAISDLISGEVLGVAKIAIDISALRRNIDL